MSLFARKKRTWFIPALKFLVFSGALYCVARFFLHAAAREFRISTQYKKRYGNEIFI